MTPAKIKWNNAQAAAEGWDIFDTASATGHPVWAILRDDEAARFADDGEAVAFVLNSAFEGSEYHRDALGIALGVLTYDPSI